MERSNCVEWTVDADVDVGVGVTADEVTGNAQTSIGLKSDGMLQADGSMRPEP